MIDQILLWSAVAINGVCITVNITLAVRSHRFTGRLTDIKPGDRIILQLSVNPDEAAVRRIHRHACEALHRDAHILIVGKSANIKKLAKEWTA